MTTTAVSARELRQRLVAELEEARARTLLLVAPLGDEELHIQHDPLMSPIVWDLGHIAHFEELWLTRNLDAQVQGQCLGPCEQALHTRGQLGAAGAQRREPHQRIRPGDRQSCQRPEALGADGLDDGVAHHRVPGVEAERHPCDRGRGRVDPYRLVPRSRGGQRPDAPSRAASPSRKLRDDATGRSRRVGGVDVDPPASPDLERLRPRGMGDDRAVRRDEDALDDAGPDVEPDDAVRADGLTLRARRQCRARSPSLE